jgi:D-arabinose 5-phosphate isomerase GutQ/beta-phosphoglucomutase-like phosphatase (HAD superfamily)
MGNNYTTILEYDLFVFDFDGTLMDTEDYHRKSWENAIKTITKKEHFELTLNEYHKHFHTLHSINMKNYAKLIHNIEDYDKLYDLKQENYKKFIETDDISFIEGAKDFLKFIIHHNKKFVIVSNTRREFIDIFLLKHPILNHVLEIFTKECFINCKPHPECYLLIANKYKNYKKIGFEDSYIGIHSLSQVSSIDTVFIYNKHYLYNDEIKIKYNNAIFLENYCKKLLNQSIINLYFKRNKKMIENNENLNYILDNNIYELQYNYNNMRYIISQISIFVKNIGNHSIYLTGMGKSGYVCKKSASTWQSLSIKCSYIDLPNLSHGDFGLLQDNDVIIFISNSGNTRENVETLKYIKNVLRKKITTISIVANNDSEMQKYSNFTYILNPIYEADTINMTPSTSSLLFMALLDGIAIYSKKDITKEEFQHCHPAGSIGKL